MKTINVSLRPPKPNNPYNALERLVLTDGAPPAVLYSYAPGRSAGHAVALFNGFTGVLQTDGYAAYHNPSYGIGRD